MFVIVGSVASVCSLLWGMCHLYVRYCRVCGICMFVIVGSVASVILYVRYCGVCGICMFDIVGSVPSVC